MDGIYADVKNYIKNCIICEQIHKNIYNQKLNLLLVNILKNDIQWI